MRDKNEFIWNNDLIKLLKKEFPNLGIFKGRILKDIIIQKRYSHVGKEKLCETFFS